MKKDDEVLMQGSKKTLIYIYEKNNIYIHNKNVGKMYHNMKLKEIYIVAIL